MYPFVFPLFLLNRHSTQHAHESDFVKEIHREEILIVIDDFN